MLTVALSTAPAGPMPDPQPDPQPDFTRMTFPTDRLTVAALRKAYPWAFDQPHHDPYRRGRWFGGRASLEEAIGDTLDFERRLATLEFKRVLGLTPNAEEGRHPQWELAESLRDEYATLGLAAGEHHADQLVRGIESQAAAQARQAPGGRPR